MPAGDEPRPDADGRPAEQAGRNDADGPEVGVGMEDVVPGVGAEDAEQAEQHGDADRDPDRPFAAEFQAVQRGQADDGKPAGQ